MLMIEVSGRPLEVGKGPFAQGVSVAGLGRKHTLRERTGGDRTNE